ncbi:hypothetical protein DFH09DRAFT_1478613 [Mycena vulgaris]|nr:hypothetical protein DFH09DRAFT_1478613 [Mycena vulgaris]
MTAGRYGGMQLRGTERRCELRCPRASIVRSYSAIETYCNLPALPTIEKGSAQRDPVQASRADDMCGGRRWGRGVTEPATLPMERRRTRWLLNDAHAGDDSGGECTEYGSREGRCGTASAIASDADVIVALEDTRSRKEEVGGQRAEDTHDEGIEANAPAKPQWRCVGVVGCAMARIRGLKRAAEVAAQGIATARGIATGH